MRTIILTCKIPDSDFSELKFQEFVNREMGDTVTNWKTMPDTKEMYKTNTTFKKLVKGVKTAQKLRDDFIHENN